MKQYYNNYTEDNHHVWRVLFERQSQNLSDKACTSYLECLEVMRPVLNYDHIPKFEELDSILDAETGWRIEVVPGHIPVDDFFRLLAEKKFPSSTWLRSMEQLDYLEEPDMFHDIFGHVPLLMDGKYAEFMHRIGRLGVKWAANKTAVQTLRSLYWFTIEFGLVCETGGRRIYGAGILSSFGESLQVMDAATECAQFDLKEIIQMDFRTDSMQNTYFTANSFDAFLRCIGLVEKYLVEMSNMAIAGR
jgi:phenylalanine-4-hydroxylase